MVGSVEKDRTDRITAPFFAAPRHWDIKFMRGRRTDQNSGGGENNYLHKLKTSVITSMTVNHDPDSVVSFHEDGSPVHSSLTLAFQELEYVTSNDGVDAAYNESVQKAAALNNQRMERQRIAAEGGPPG